MTGRIITVRHGRPNLSREVKITGRGYGDWWKQYDLSGLHPDERPPAELVTMAKSMTTVLSSTLPRAVETAAYITEGKREVPADVIYVEAPLPAPPIPFLKLRPGPWGVVSRTFWFYGYAPGGMENHFQAWKRVQKIADRLREYASSGDVMLCAHGYLNWMINRKLRSQGWDLASREGGNDYWSWRVFEPSGEQQPIAGNAAAAK